MLAKVVSYGGNSVRYALEKENAKTVKVNNMPDGLYHTAIWYMMKHHCQYHQAERTVGRKLERFMTIFVLSPSKEESAIQQYQRAESKLGGAVTTISKKVDTINQYIDKVLENAPQN